MKKADVSKREFVLEGFENYDGTKENKFITFTSKGLRHKTDMLVFKRHFKRAVYGKEVDLVLLLKTLVGCPDAYVLTVNMSNSSKCIRKELMLDGIGSGVTLVIAKLMMDLAEGFCFYNNLKVCNRNGYSPILDYIVQEDAILKMHGK